MVSNELRIHLHTFFLLACLKKRLTQAEKDFGFAQYFSEIRHCSTFPVINILYFKKFEFCPRFQQNLPLCNIPCDKNFTFQSIFFFQRAFLSFYSFYFERIFTDLVNACLLSLRVSSLSAPWLKKIQAVRSK